LAVAKPEKISDALAGALERAGLGRIMALQGLCGKWRTIAGEGMAKHSMPVMLKGGTLTLVVDSPAWMNEISLLSPTIIEKLNTELGEEAVSDIRLRQGKVEDRATHSGAAPAGKFRPVTRPLTAEEEDEIEKALSSIEDGGLKESARRMLLAAYTTKKQV